MHVHRCSMALVLSKLLRIAFSPSCLLVTNTISCTVLLGLGDLLEQKLRSGRWTNKSSSTDECCVSIDADHYARSKRVGQMGLPLGVMNHYWYKMLDKYVEARTMRKLIAIKVGLDFLVSPIFACTFVVGVALLEGEDVTSALREYRRKAWSVLKLDFVVWPPSQLINFWLLPPQARVIYVSLVQLFYNVCLCYIKHAPPSH